MATQEQYGLIGVSTPMLASRSSRTGRVTATTLEHKGLTQTGVRKFINKSVEEKDAAAKALEGVESILRDSPDGDCRANGSSDGRYVVRVVPCAPKVPHAPKESRSRTTRRKYFVEAQPGAAEAEQSTQSGEVHKESGDARVQRSTKEGARQRTVPSSFATAETDEQTARDRDSRTLETKRAVPTAGVEEAKTENTAAATAVTSNTKSRAAFESQSSDRIAKSDVAEETMSAVVKLAKDTLEPHDIDQLTEECHLMVWPHKRKLVTQGYDSRPVQGGEDTEERVKMPHSEMCEKKSEVTSVEEGHDVERVIVLKDETSADLTALEKKGLDRKTNHVGLTKAEPRSTRPPPWRDKSRNRGESMLWLASSYWKHEATIQEGVKKYHLCLSFAINSLLNVKARSPHKFMNASDMKVWAQDGYMTHILTIKANNKIVNVRIWINPVFSKIVFQPLHSDTDKSSEEKAQSTYEETVKINQERSHESMNLVPENFVKLTFGGLIPADCVGREIWTRPR